MPRSSILHYSALGVMLFTPLTMLSTVARASMTPGENASSQQSTAEKTTPDKDGEKEQADPYIVPEGNADVLTAYLDNFPEPKRREDVDRALKAFEEATNKLLAAGPNDEQYELAIIAKMREFKNDAKVAKKFLDAQPKEVSADRKRTLQCADAHIEAMKMFKGEPTREEWKTHLKRTVDLLVAEPPKKKWEIKVVGRIDAEIAKESMLQLLQMEDSDSLKAIMEWLRKSDDPKSLDYADMAEGSLRQVELLGNRMKVEGTTFDGKPFDAKETLRGKYVLVDFFTTWCGPCNAEIPELRRLYDFYHEKGFEILAISADDERAAMEKFMAKKKLPWIVLYGKDGPIPTVKYYAVIAYPTMLFVGKDGKVISLNARGEELRKLLAESLGPMPEEKKNAKKNAGDTQEKDGN